MKKEREEMLERLRNIKQIAESYLKANKFQNYVVMDVIHYSQRLQLVNKQTNKKEEFDLYAVQAENTKPEMGGASTFELEYLVDKNGNIVTISDLIREYEGFESIKDVVDKSSENERRPEKEQDEGLKKDSLKELETERKKEDKEENKETRKKRKPSYVIERVNPDKAKMDYWKTVKQACGLPEKVHTLAFSYPVSSEDKVDYANITVYMLDKDGYIIDDLDVDDYFEFDSSTGNNPTQDNVLRHEEDENEGTAQIEKHRTMIRLYAKNSNDKNTYISLEQKNSLADYNDINAGRKTVAGTQNVEKQLETDRVRVWDSERELLMRSNAGMYHVNDMIEEAETYEKHGDKDYVHGKNSDGYSHTKVPCGKHIYLVIECLIKLKEKDYIRDRFSDRELVGKIINTIDKNPDITQDELISKLEGDIIGDSEKEHRSNDEGEKSMKEEEDYSNDGPWRNSMSRR